MEKLHLAWDVRVPTDAALATKRIDQPVIRSAA